jgi:hypothetical protein
MNSRFPVSPSNTPPVSIRVVGALGPAGSTVMEAQQLRARLNAVHQQILNLPAQDPNQWQRLLEEYAVAASALYMTILPAD